MEELESRQLLSADFALLPVDPSPHAGSILGEASVPALVSSQPSDAAALVAERREVVFVDARVADQATLLADLARGSSGARRVEIILLDAERDGIVQITEALAERKQVDAVHVIAHGNDGAIQIGNSWLDARSLAASMEAVASWSHALKHDGDLLIYGCDLAASARGRALVDWLADLTQADVAASVDATGAAVLGGNWTLEYRRGAIEAEIAVGAAGQHAWEHLLPTVSFQEGVGGYAGTHDTELEEPDPDQNNGGSTSITVDLSSGGGESQALIRFDGIFGVGAGQIPLGATITSATLTFNVANPSSGSATIGVHRMLVAWDEGSATWNSLGDGLDAGTDYAAAADATVPNPNATGAVTVAGLEGSLQAWANGDSNYGWAIVTDDTDGWDFDTSEDGSSANRPLLTATYVPPVNAAPVLDAAQAPVLGPVVQNSPAPSGAVGTPVSALVDFASPAGQVDNVTDANLGALLGIAVTAADATNGAWWYSTDDGASWLALAALSDASARLLAADAGTRIYFQPNPGFVGPIANAITFRAWDQTSGANGALADATTNGGTTAFSIATGTAAIVVTSQPPTLDLDADDSSGVTPVSATDDFSSNSYSGPSGGSIPWAGDWIEPANDAGTSQSPADGDTRIEYVDLGSGLSHVLSLGDPTGSGGAVPASAQRAIDLSSFTNASLSFDLATSSNLEGGDSYRVRVSADGGTNWATLQTYSNDVTGTQTLSLAGFESANTLIRFDLTSNFQSNEFVYIDNVSVTADPVASTGFSNTFIENGAAVAIADADTLITDPDGAVPMSGATIAITDPQAGDILSFADTANVAGAWNPATYTLTLSGTDTIAAYQAALATVTFSSSSDNPGTRRAIEVVVTDATGAPSNAATSRITIVPTNDPPESALPGGQSVQTGQTLLFSSATGNALSVTDVDGDPLTVTLAVTGGTLTLSGTAGLTFSTGDGSADASMTFGGSIADINAALEGLTYSSPGAPGSQTLTVTTSDGVASDVDLLTINVTSAAPRLDLDASDAAQTASDDFQSGGFTGSTGTLLWETDWIEANDSGAAQSPTSGDIRVVTFSSSQRLRVGGDLTNTTGIAASREVDLPAQLAAPSYHYTLSFDYTTNNNLESSDQLVVEISADGGANYAILETFANDRTGTASYVIDAYASADTVVRFRTTSGYTHNNEYFYVDNLSISATPTSYAASYTENAAPVNIAGSTAATINDSDSAALSQLVATLGNWVDGDRLAVDGTTIALTDGNSGTTGGTAALAYSVSVGTGTATLTLTGDRPVAAYQTALRGVAFDSTSDDPTAGGASPTRTVSIFVSDTSGAASNAAISVITVNPVNDAPVANDDLVLTDEDTPVNFDVRTNDTDLDGGALSVTEINGSAIAVGGAVAVANGAVTLEADGTLTFTPAADFSGAASFTYTLSDGALTDTATVNVTVNPVNDAPVANDDLVLT
ncbi:MAG: DUF4347 domain-containing protein, partial [Burkholderiales bacterium]|nr:DUF4347 domain-containing protein [Burkholderiales bacterium]